MLAVALGPAHFFHIGWIGPLFWPYAHGDIYQAVFFPYSYDDYVQGPRAPERMARLQQGIVQGCNEGAGEVTGWPIDQIQAAVAPISGRARCSTISAIEGPTAAD
jgi:hypothetical protein